MSEFDDVGVAVLDPSSVLEAVVNWPGSVVAVVVNPILVELDADIDRVVESDNEVTSDVELPKDDDTVVGKPGT